MTAAALTVPAAEPAECGKAGEGGVFSHPSHASAVEASPLKGGEGSLNHTANLHFQPQPPQPAEAKTTLSH